MTDPRPKPLAEAREDRDALIDALGLAEKALRARVAAENREHGTYAAYDKARAKADKLEAKALAAIASLHTGGEGKGERPAGETEHNETDGFVDGDPHKPTPVPATGETDDPSADAHWQEGCDFVMLQLCAFVGVDPQAVNWDAATETLDGDVRAVIGNIVRARMGENWSPSQPPVPPAADAAGWWVQPEWRRDNVQGSRWDLWLGHLKAGTVYEITTGGRWVWYQAWRAPHDDDHAPTREEAQAALLAAVRPKDAGAKP